AAGARQIAPHGVGRAQVDGAAEHDAEEARAGVQTDAAEHPARAHPVHPLELLEDLQAERVVRPGHVQPRPGPRQRRTRCGHGGSPSRRLRSAARAAVRAWARSLSSSSAGAAGPPGRTAALTSPPARMAISYSNAASG